MKSEEENKKTAKNAVFFTSEIACTYLQAG
jgi:hypothetical protein